MARLRINFHSFLKNFVSSYGNYPLYFQEPSSTVMKYPCVRYKQLGVLRLTADNEIYLSSNKYQLIVMSWDIDDPLAVAMQNTLGFNMENTYDTDNLHHWVFNYYY